MGFDIDLVGRDKVNELLKSLSFSLLGNECPSCQHYLLKKRESQVFLKQLKNQMQTYFFFHHETQTEGHQFNETNTCGSEMVLLGITWKTLSLKVGRDAKSLRFGLHLKPKSAQFNIEQPKSEGGD